MVDAPDQESGDRAPVMWVRIPPLPPTLPFEWPVKLTRLSRTRQYFTHVASIEIR